MAAIVRVKRRINDDPADSLVFSSKRPRKDNTTEASGDNGTEEVKNLFKFAGTVQSEDDCVSRAVRDAIKKEKLEKEFKLHSVDPGAIMSRARARSKAGRESGRYKVVSQRRALQLEDLDREDKENDPANKTRDEKLPYKKSDNKENEETTEGEANRLYLLWDVEHEGKAPMMPKPIGRPKHTNESTITCNSVPMEREAVTSPGGDDQYVYDLYYMNRRDIDMRSLDNVLNIEALANDVNFDQYRQPEELECYDDEDDSNDESNWRNDYPDEDPKFFESRDEDYTVGSEDYGRSFGLDDDDELGTIIDRGLHLGGSGFGQELSSDEEEPEPAYDFNQPLDSSIWGQDAAAASNIGSDIASNIASNIWGTPAPPVGGLPANSDAMADDWVSKSLDTNFDLNPGSSAIWGSSIMSPWLSASTETAAPEVEEPRGSSRLWAPATDFDQYKARIMRELGDDDDNTDLT